MSFWDPILALFGLPRPKKRRAFEVDEDIYPHLEELAIYQRRPARELANDLLLEALEFWRILSRREQEVAALFAGWDFSAWE